uniref:Calcium-activated chloride channel regulator 1-like n=1 Tax=Saccoglossus kowalevskii TaxID=10224 RepID=A0ABM0LVE9_SACKO|nr:PREDICTED: calcium-activated chloride channel regulator 1-like [Saccoglossus kowalevskii]
MKPRNPSVFVILILASQFVRESDGSPTVEIVLRDNGYEGIVIAIHNYVKEDTQLIQKIQDTFTAASAFLYTATNYRTYFRNITLLIPLSWSNKPEYEMATFETFEKAPIVVQKPNPLHGNVPYVKQYGDCGVGGEQMHLTPAFFNDLTIPDNQGPLDRVIVHEWGHLRWGLFDEYVTDVNQSWFYMHNGEIHPVACNSEIQGEWSPSAACERRDDVTGLPPPECKFIPNQDQSQQVTASIMYAQWINTIASFCNNNSSEPHNYHNKIPENRQNRLCQGQSSWEVMLQHEDFKNNVNLPRLMIDTTPTFNIVKTGRRRVVLVLDTSGSMAGNRIERLHRDTTHFILNVIDDDSFVGIIQFSSDATVLSEMKKIDYASRPQIAASVPYSANGGTNFGAGIRAALQELKESQLSLKGASLLIITDGQFSYTSDVTDEVYASGVRVDTIAYTQAAEDSLRVLSDRTGGSYYYVSDDETSTELLDSLTSTITDRPVDNYEQIPINIADFVLDLSNNNETGSLFVDSSVGNHTVFTFTYSVILQEVRLTSPSGDIIDSNANEYVLYEELKQVCITIQGIAEAGSWNYYIYVTNSNQLVTITLKSRITDVTNEPIKVRGILGRSYLNYMEDPTLVIYAEVTKGGIPVMNADVLATVNRPTGGPKDLVLRDSGSGGDIVNGDGIYSAFFVDFSICSYDVCTYGVKITATNYNDKATINQYGIFSSAFPINPENTLENVTTVSADLFSRVASGGAFDVQDSPQNEGDILDVHPPSRIHDLKVQETSYENSSIVLTWTAVGDDRDQGKGTHFDINIGKYSRKDGLYS